MNDLDQVVEKVLAGGRQRMDWLVLINVHFRGEERPIERIKAWAEEKGIAVIFESDSVSLTHQVVRDVLFLPKRKTR